MSFVKIENVSKTYQPDGDGSAMRVLADVNATIEEGEFVCLMGPSGSGKSTLLTMLGGVDVPTSGQVLLEGKDLASLDEFTAPTPTYPNFFSARVADEPVRNALSLYQMAAGAGIV